MGGNGENMAEAGGENIWLTQKVVQTLHGNTNALGLLFWYLLSSWIATHQIPTFWQGAK